MPQSRNRKSGGTMSGYPLYYLPGKQVPAISNAQTAKLLAEFSLSHLLGFEFACNQIHNGPDGGSGTLLLPARAGANDTGAKALYKPDRQTWRKCGAFWFGWWNDDKPSPASLRRKERYGVNSAILLNDGNHWEFTPVNALPRAFGMDADGNFTMTPQARFARFNDASEWLFDWLTSTESRKYTDIIDRVASMLSLNYAVSTPECLAL